jgi:hypothetical protein
VDVTAYVHVVLGWTGNLHRQQQQEWEREPRELESKNSETLAKTLTAKSSIL